MNFPVTQNFFQQIAMMVSDMQPAASIAGTRITGTGWKAKRISRVM